MNSVVLFCKYSVVGNFFWVVGNVAIGTCQVTLKGRKKSGNLVYGQEHSKFLVKVMEFYFRLLQALISVVDKLKYVLKLIYKLATFHLISRNMVSRETVVVEYYFLVVISDGKFCFLCGWLPWYF